METPLDTYKENFVNTYRTQMRFLVKDLSGLDYMIPHH